MRILTSIQGSKGWRIFELGCLGLLYHSPLSETGEITMANMKPRKRWARHCRVWHNKNKEQGDAILTNRLETAITKCRPGGTKRGWGLVAAAFWLARTPSLCSAFFFQKSPPWLKFLFVTLWEFCSMVSLRMTRLPV